MKFMNQKGFIPLSVIYLLIFAAALGGVSGIAFYLLSEKTANILVWVATGVVVIFMLPYRAIPLPKMKHQGSSFAEWSRSISRRKEGKDG